MPLLNDPAAPASAVVTAMTNAPEFARGLVRDLRIRWALEEIERPYRAELFEAMVPRPEEYRQRQPWGQVPVFSDGGIEIFESGAILLYLGEQDERLMPTDPAARWQATAWLIAALNSVEPSLMQLMMLDVFQAGQPWAEGARVPALDFARMRLRGVSAALGEQDWLTGQFTVADIMMVTVLRNVRHTDLVAEFSNLSAYQARGEARPAFEQALADQLDGLGDPIILGARP